MSSLLQARADLLVSLNGAFDNTTIASHGGEFDLKQLKAYGKQAPALILSLLRFDVERQGGFPVAVAYWGLICMTKNEGDGVLRDASCIALAEKASRIILPTFAGQNMNGAVSSTKGRLIARNMFSAPLDAEGIAMIGLEWCQNIDLVDSELTPDDFKSILMQYDLAPNTDGVHEAEDEITNLDLADD